jgi:hypothetical protein
MPRLSLTSLFACLACAAAAVLLRDPGAAGRVGPETFEIRVESDHTGLVQLYYDLGRDMNEADSVVRPIEAGHGALLRFPLPYGQIRALRFDPLDRSGTLTLSGGRIVDGSGATRVEFAPAQFRADTEIESAVVHDSRLVVVTTAGATDPSLRIRLPEPITIPRPSWAWEVIGLFIVLLAIVAAVQWAAAAQPLRWAERAAALRGWGLRRPQTVIVIAALLATAAANYPVLLGGRSFVSPGLGTDLLYGQNPWVPGLQATELSDPHGADVGALMWQHLPLSALEHDALLRDGELPLWNRYDSAGVPLLGQGQSCFGDPLQVIPILARGAAWAWDLKFLLAKWAFAAGIGACAWRLFRHLPAALLVTGSSAFLGFFVYRINHPAIFSLCYSPWILLCWIRLAQAATGRGTVLWLAALIGANGTEMNSGTAKEAYVLLVALNLTGALLLLLSGQPGRSKARSLGAAALAGIVFALIAAPVWFTFYRALQISYTSYNAPAAFQVPPGLLAGLFDELFYRPFQQHGWVGDPSANFLVLVGIAWVVVRLRAALADPGARALVLACLPLLALVFGVIPPAWVTAVPYLGNIQHIDNTFSCVLIVVFLVLAGFGFRDLWERIGTDEGRREAAAVAAGVAAVLALYLGTAQAVLRSIYAAYTWGKVITLPPFVYGYGLSLLLGVLVLLAALHLARRRGGWTPATILGVGAALVAFHWRLGLATGPAYADYRAEPAERVDLVAPSPALASLPDPSASPYRVTGFHNDLLGGWSSVYGLEGISGPDALINPYYRELMEAAGIPRVWDWRYLVETSDGRRHRPLLDALGVRYYLGYHLGKAVPGPELTPVRSADLDVFESATAWPRAFFTDSVAVYQDTGQYWSWLRSGDGRPFAGIQVRDWARLSPQPRVSGDLRTRHVEAADHYRLTGNTTAFRVQASAPGFIVLTEAYEPDNFRAWLNGKRVPYFRVNQAFKGIYVDAPGTYEVRYAYWPHALSRCLELSVLGLCLTGAAMAWAVRPRRTLKPSEG